MRRPNKSPGTPWHGAPCGPGKTTTLYIESKGFKTTTTAKMQTYEGISQSIIDFFKKETYNELS